MNIQHSTFNIRVSELEPLTSRQRWFVVVLALVTAATRFLAVSHSMWDWDEVLFASALHHYDVAQHHPHPPGFPLFFALAKLVRLFVHDDFRALRAVSTAASLFVFPAIFALARSLRFRFRTFVIAALLFSFLPNVWYWGGTGFTDELALVTALAGAAFLLRDDRRSTYILGCFFFAATMLVRAQNVLLAWPWIVASWRRWRGSRRDVIIGTAMIVVLVVTGYGIAVMLTGVDDYLFALKSHQEYIVNVDGLLNPIRLPMREIFFRFLFNPFQSRAASTAMCAFTLIAFARPRRAHLDIVATFLPNFFLTWFFLNPTGVSRLSLGYIAMNALLAADGMDVAATFSASRLRARERVALALQAVFAAVLIGRYIVWTWPGLREVRLHDSPPVQAMRWVRQNAPRGSRIYLASVLEPFPPYFLGAEYTIVPAPDRFDPSTAPAERNAYFVTDVPSQSPDAVNFRRPHTRLWSLFNERYFESSIQPITGWIRFGPGWYVPEQGGNGEAWRWMAKESHTFVEGLAAPAAVGFSATFPLEGEPAPHVTVMFDGKLIDQFVPQKKDVERHYAVQSRGGAPDELVIAVDQAINPARAHQSGDSRDLGMQLHNLTWKRR